MTFLFFLNQQPTLRQGYNIEKIKANAPQEYNEVLGETCYLLPLTKVSESEIYQQIDEELLQAERALKKKASASKEAAAVQGDQIVDLMSDDEGPVEETDDGHLDKDTRKRLRQEAKKAEAEEKKRRKAAEAEAKAAARKVFSQNAKLVKVSTSCSPLLVSCMEELPISTTAAENSGSINMNQKETAAKFMDELKEWKVACTHVLQQHQKPDPGPLTLPFASYKEVQEKAKVVKTFVATLKAVKNK